MKDQSLNASKRRLKPAHNCILIAVACFLGLTFHGASFAATTSDMFAFDFLRESVRSNNGNVVISPYGAFVALSMLANGAEASTRSEILRVLKVGDSLTELNQSNAKSLGATNAETKVQLKIANAIFVDKDFPVLKSFTQSVEESYKAEVRNLSFLEPDSVKTINGWVSEKTQGRIPILIERLRAGDCAVLLNAVYFKGLWQSAFKKTDTADSAFHLENGTVKQVPMMKHETKYPYYKGENFEALSLPYQGAESLIVLLPDRDKKASDICRELDAKGWAAVTKGLHEEEVDLELPRFQISFSEELKPMLERMGMTNCFSPRSANFKALSSTPAYVGRAIQKTFIDVNEEGTEAAAATAIVMHFRAMSAVKPKPLEFKVDRPFIIALKEEGTGSLLFLGLVNEP